jgi:hypothetical protein
VIQVSYLHEEPTITGKIKPTRKEQERRMLKSYLKLLTKGKSAPIRTNRDGFMLTIDVSKDFLLDLYIDSPIRLHGIVLS